MIQADFFSELLPKFILNRVRNKFLRDGDIGYNTLTGPTEKIYFNGCEVTKISSTGNTGRAYTFNLSFTYDNKTNFAIGIDKSMDIDPKKISDLIDNIINKLHVA